jgi:type I restriction enzyme S subunit
MRLCEGIEFNPRESISKGVVAKKVAMERLMPFSKIINGYELAKYKGGSKFRNGDTLLARITPCLENGKTAKVTILDNDEIGYGSTEFIVMRGKVNKTDDDFIYYLSISPVFRDIAIKSMVGTSGRQRVQQDILENIRMPIPGVCEQKTIAATLSCLDDKIELNNRINKTLEEMAQAIFKSWFVDFEPFQNGEFIDSELGKIPKGWRVGTVKDLGDVVGGSTPSKSCTTYYTKRCIPWVTPKDLSNNKNKFIFRGSIDITPLGFEKSGVKLMPKGTVLFSSRAPIGYMAIAMNNITTNQGFKSVVPKSDIGTEYVYYFLRNSIGMIESRASGTTFKEVSGSVMKQIPALIPSQDVLLEFQNICRIYFQKQLLLENQNALLSSIRDALLPKLMSGEVRVPIEEVL